MAGLAALQKTLGVRFNNPSRLEQALVHSSYLNENPDFATVSNERLEFLGDAVLGMVIAEKLYQDFPRLTEGEMTLFRAALVRRDTLAHLARSIDLGNYLCMGKGETASGGRQKTANLAGALEAVVAAIYLDQGLIKVREFILKLFADEWQKTGLGAEMDYKSSLQELVQSREQKTPTYHLLEAAGPAHNQTFTVEVRVGDSLLGRGSGKSKKAAEAEAARVALKRFSANFTE